MTSEAEGAGSSVIYQPFGHIARSVTLSLGLLCPGGYFVCTQCLVIGANVINRAGEGTAHLKILSDASVQTTIQYNDGM